MARLVRTYRRNDRQRATGRLRTCAISLSAAMVICAGSTSALAQFTKDARPDDASRGVPKTPTPEFAPAPPNKGQEGGKDGSDAATLPPDVPQFPVGAFVITYALDHPQLPGIEDLLLTEVTLSHAIDGYIAPRPGVPEETIVLGDVSLGPSGKFSVSALNAVTTALAKELNRQGVVGVTVATSEKEFGVDPETNKPKDLRKPGQIAVTLVVKVLLVKELRTIAFGERIPPERRINAEEHARILDNSPLAVFEGGEPQRYDLLRKDLLDEYVFRLNRHPGRRVDIAVSAADNAGAKPSDATDRPPDGLAVDLLVNENKTWLAYFQISNTGTRQTNIWRERFGFVENQVTDSDDVLSLDYITAGFDASHAFSASYERPVYGDWVRGKIFGQWNQYTASDVGQTNERFRGEGYTVGGELIANIFQDRELFVDGVVGLRYQELETTNEATANLRGSGKFLIPSFAVRLERQTESQTTTGSLGIDFNVSDAVGTGTQEFRQLGRQRPDADFATLNWDITHSMYLDQWIFGDSWKDTSEQGNPTLAHELVLGFRGQYAFENRLVPNFEQIAGGLFSVRGYPESVAAGDTVVVGSIEYRLHIPQAFGYDPEPGQLFGKPFRYQPQSPYGRADWDIIAKAFFDAGRTINSKIRNDIESDQTLLGTGVGFEFLFKRNFTVRVDWGVALNDIREADGTLNVKSGSNRFHILATLLF